MPGSPGSPGFGKSPLRLCFVLRSPIPRGLVTITDPSAAVYTLLEEITLRPRSDLRGSVRLGRDLQVDRETYSLRLIPALERRLGIRPSQLEWGQVQTVQDLLTLAQAHATRGTLVVDSPGSAV